MIGISCGGHAPLLNDGNFGAGLHAGAGGGSGQRRAAGGVGGRQQDTDPGADLAGEPRTLKRRRRDRIASDIVSHPNSICCNPQRSIDIQLYSWLNARQSLQYASMHRRERSYCAAAAFRPLPQAGLQRAAARQRTGWRSRSSSQRQVIEVK